MSHQSISHSLEIQFVYHYVCPLVKINVLSVLLRHRTHFRHHSTAHLIQMVIRRVTQALIKVSHLRHSHLVQSVQPSVSQFVCQHVMPSVLKVKNHMNHTVPKPLKNQLFHKKSQSIFLSQFNHRQTVWIFAKILVCNSVYNKDNRLTNAVHHAHILAKKVVHQAQHQALIQVHKTLKQFIKHAYALHHIILKFFIKNLKWLAVKVPMANARAHMVSRFVCRHLVAASSAAGEGDRIMIVSLGLTLSGTHQCYRLPSQVKLKYFCVFQWFSFERWLPYVLIILILL